MIKLQVFLKEVSSDIYKIFKNIFFNRTPLLVASDESFMKYQNQ